MEFIATVRDGLGHILADNVLYVPTYQRSYAWKKAHIEALLEDLAGAIRKRSESEAPSAYFLGSVVAIKKTDSSEDLEIVDGQQRLATTSIIFVAIRDYFIRIGDTEAADSIEKTYIRYFDMRTRDWPARLRLNEVDNDFYLNWVIAKPGERKAGPKATKPSHKRLSAAYRTAWTYINQLAEAYSTTDANAVLIDWINFLRDDAQIIRVTVRNAADAYVIFETLNDRGLELSTADLLKNYLFGLSGDRIEEAKARWSAMIGALETVTNKELTVDYIRQFWGSRYGVIRKRELFYHIKDAVTNKRAAIALGTELEENSKLYAAILNPTHDLWTRYGTAAKQALATIRLLRMERLRPLLLSILSAFSDHEVRKALTYLVAATVRLNLAGGSAGPVESALAAAAVGVREKRVKNAAALAKELSPVIPTNNVFEAFFSATRVKNASMARYYLRALDEAYISEESDEPKIYVVSENEEDLCLEHIFPERGREGDWKHIPVEKADELCRRVGNMVLLSPKLNSALKSSAFQDKVKVYAESNNVRLTKALADKYGKVTLWGEKQITEWQAILARLALKAWPIKVK